MKKALFTAANRSFFPGAFALLQSARRHHPDVERWCMVQESDRDLAQEQFGHLAHIVTPPRTVNGIPEQMQVFVPKLFANTIPADVVAYVDSDAFFCRPAPELWEVEPGQVNAVADRSQNVLASVPHSMRPEFIRQFPQLLEKKGFNGGVWALAPRDYPDLTERYEAALVAGAYTTYEPIFDQPMLNALFQPNVRWLPLQFNVNNLFDTPIPADARIVHFTGGTCKPWDSRYPKHEPQFYWWLRHGLNERRPERLILAKARIVITTPKRWLGRRVRRLFTGK